MVVEPWTCLYVGGLRAVLSETGGCVCVWGGGGGQKRKKKESRKERKKEQGKKERKERKKEVLLPLQ